MKNKTVLITGANSGIGYITALEIAKLGAKIVMVCRNKDKAETARQEIINKSNNTNISVKICNLSSQAAIKELAQEIKNEIPVIDVLVNNAGVMLSERQESIDGIEMTWAVNHLAYFLLTNLLIDSLKAAPSARIVNVASQVQQIGDIYWTDVNLRNGYSGLKAYSQSKLANIMFSNELARRLAGTNITSNALHPGAVATNFGNNSTGFIAWAFKWFAWSLRSPEKGAQTSLWLASSKDVEGKTGLYFNDKKSIKAKAIAYHAEALQRLWAMSEEMTGIKTLI
ncbi:MAG: SDR family oxidoreductase [Thermoflexibacter sp.]|jgi:NAD(P)-dependent dehydrogenase (short-subunit alcohol dehydrogenase family)|nr:SDR family oxidoreductase [Thermoflexibacter sp.]